MDMELLKRVCNAPGVPGYEDEAQAVVMETLRGSCGEVRRDRLGNVIGLKKATRPPSDGMPRKVVLAAHVDEIGMMVKHIDSNGFIRFEPMGGLNAQVIVSQRVVVHGRKPVGAVVVPDTRADSKDKVTKVEEAYLDTGLPRDALCELVSVGDVVTFAPGVELLNEKVYVGRNFDDRIGTYCLLEAMGRVGDTAVDVYAVSSVQEEVGLRGMRPAAYAIEPDIGVAIDGSLTWGPYAGEHVCTCTLGKGTGIYIMDRLTIGDRRLVRFLFDLCERLQIPCQSNVGGGTDASAIQQSRAGALTTTIGAPVRYMHSTVQLCHADDIEATVELLAKFLEHAHDLLPDER
ncbi:MAG TPA: M42 family peptidase [Planctomycetota bacterium]|nr:M42 family peptidase [Planctomycetota bacterium]